jgi:hypothetical protein
MALGISQPPDAAVQALRDGLAALAQRGEFTTRALRKVRPEQVAASVPHPVYNLGARSAAGGTLDDAEVTGWRFLLTADTDVMASAETRIVSSPADRGGAGEQAFAQVTDGPFVRGTVDAVAVAGDAAGQRPERYELRLLHVPAIYLMAVWLHAPDAGDSSGDAGDRPTDLYVPIAPAPAGIEANRAYEADEFRRAVVPLAAAVPPPEADERRGG